MRDGVDFNGGDTCPAITAHDMEAHFAWAAGRDGWNARADWILIEALCRGDGLAVAAARADRSVAECRKRWNLLFPEPRRLEVQRLVVLEARRRFMEDAGNQGTTRHPFRAQASPHQGEGEP